MDYIDLKKLKEKFYFTINDLTDALGIKPQSARVVSSRYAKKGIFVRLKNNFYTLDQNFENFSKEDCLKIANLLQVPSYVSFMSALSLYEITTQLQKDFFESVSLKRSVKFNIKGKTFNFYKLKKAHYFDFIKRNGIFIATKEKAFVDSIYLYSLGRYKLDFNSLDLDKLSKKRLIKIMRVFPQKTKDIVKKLCGI